MSALAVYGFFCIFQMAMTFDTAIVYVQVDFRNLYTSNRERKLYTHLNDPYLHLPL